MFNKKCKKNSFYSPFLNIVFFSVFGGVYSSVLDQKWMNPFLKHCTNYQMCHCEHRIPWTIPNSGNKADQQELLHNAAIMVAV